MASDLQDTVVQTRVDGGDVTALEVKYHLSYITELRKGIALFSDKIRALIVMEMRVKLEQGLLLSLLLL